CTFSGNSSTGLYSGGGIYNTGSSNPTVMNCTFVGNSSDDFGGAMGSSASNPTILNCTFSGNWASYGGAIESELSSSSVLTNCIPGGHRETAGWEFNSGAGGAITATYCDIQGGWDGAGSGNIDTDPLLTPDGHLKAGSPCINVGTTSGAPTTDIDGEP